MVLQGKGRVSPELEDILLSEKFGVTVEQLDMMPYEEVLMRTIVANRREAYPGGV